MILKILKKVFILPSSLILGAALFSFAFGNGLMDSLLPVFTIQKMGWTNTYFSEIIATAKIVAGLLGMFAGDALVDFFEK